jgi:transcriptional regulator with XRE-family HTH domain
MFCCGVFYHRKQAFFTSMVYFISMKTEADIKTDLTARRESAGLTVRELARQLGIHHTTVLQWERTGKVAKSEFLAPVAKILGITVEELLGQPKSRRSAAPAGRARQTFEEVSKLPRTRQKKILDVVDALLKD